MAFMTRPKRLVCRALADVMHEGCIEYLRIVAEQTRLMQAHQCVDAGVNLGVKLGRLWHAKQCVDFGQDNAERLAVAQYGDKRLGAFTC